MSSKNKFKKTHNSIEEDSDDSYYRDDDSDHMEISSSANSGIEPTSEDDDSDKELKSMSFGERVELNKLDSSSMRKDRAQDTTAIKPKKKRKNSEPAEVPATAPVKRLRQVIQVQKQTTRDPRFDNLSGKFDEAVFEKRYGFIHEMRKQELQSLQEMERKVKDPVEKERIRKAISILEQQIKTEEDKKLKREVLHQFVKEQRERVKEGKRPYFLKRRELKEAIMKKKFEELKKKGGDLAVQKYLSKKRKRKAAKEHKFVPRKRRATESGSVDVSYDDE